MLTAYVNSTIFTGDACLQGYAVLTSEGRITDVLPLAQVPADAGVVDLKDTYLSPAFIDLQIYGGNGRIFPSQLDSATLHAIYEYSSAGGAAFFMPTLPTHSYLAIRQAIEAVRRYWEEGGPGVLGLHLEGPFINPEKKGAHPEKYIKIPTEEEIDLLLKHGEGILKMMTLAPECCDPALVKKLQSAGVVISAGHSNADYKTAYNSFEAGIPTATHLFNAMSPLQSRAPGLVGAIYDHPQVCASVVADGIHVDFNAIRISKKIMGDRLFLITDAVEEGGEEPYKHIRKADHFVNSHGILSGSCLTMQQAVKNCITKVGIAPEEALRMASTYPAKVAGLQHELGKIAPGYRAAMVALNAEWDIEQFIGLS